MAPMRRWIILLLFAVLLVSQVISQSEPTKDKKQGRKVSELGPSYMRKRTHLPSIFIRPYRPTLAILLVS
ncbi:hypothetical protein L5515_003097 [Caenorhabditis briggsae]|uniref:Uncharacterized protein n=2 Tax=Caenorhabditis TaxID=6237 RepID=A0AAE9EL11_CAEBR|nr:hypothetical protein B9Z55_008710 [Caenorhabditis nigoni]ULT98705.1 hypothetical protein L3Y34_000225 [Caenorhabditis briggsae]UMM21396.1 hypothetical protein L5515_003097 [Caenorhabditis briggsae]